jgi:hypothetical protein
MARMRLAWGLVLVAVSACGPAVKKGETVPEAPRPTWNASKVRSFTDTFPVTSIADTAHNLWIGSTHGLIRWDLAAGRYSVIGQRDGLPADRVAAVAVDSQGAVWVATAKGISRGKSGAFTNLPAPPVGDFLAGLVPAADGKSAFAGGPEGLARLRGKNWERFLDDTAITALMLAPGGAVWVGTSGRGVVRVQRGGDKLDVYGEQQGCDVDTVRGIAGTDRGLLVIGEGPRGPRVAWFDGERFYSYEVQTQQTLEWAARAGSQVLVGAGEHVYEIRTAHTDEAAAQAPAAGPLRLVPLPAMWTAPARELVLKPGLTGKAIDDLAPVALAGKKGRDGKELPAPRSPRLDVTAMDFRLPEGVTSVASSERGLLVGTRFSGALRIENGVVRSFRTNDLAQGAQRLTVGCVDAEECYVATGGARAWKFDGQSFEIAPIDPEPGARVLAVLRDPKGGVLAIHRGAGSSQLRISQVAAGSWMPVAMQAVQVPHGAPELNFAELAPDGRLWMGLRYVDKDQDAIDYGAAEIVLDGGKVIYHRQGPLDGSSTFGASLPSDMVAMYWKSKDEAWFATRQGAARMRGNDVRVFTENDGLESELIYDISGGAGNGEEIWVATRRGTGRYDGRRWTFPKMGPFYLKATSLARDHAGHTFIGTEKGLYCTGDCPPEPVDTRRGLLDDAVVDASVDPRGRVWVLTHKGISIVDP